MLWCFICPWCICMNGVSDATSSSVLIYLINVWTGRTGSVCSRKISLGSRGALEYFISVHVWWFFGKTNHMLFAESEEGIMYQWLLLLLLFYVDVQHTAAHAGFTCFGMWKYITPACYTRKPATYWSWFTWAPPPPNMYLGLCFLKSNMLSLFSPYGLCVADTCTYRHSQIIVRCIIGSVGRGRCDMSIVIWGY